jgi:methylenetetrahydrofolate reductase (NADPH)
MLAQMAPQARETDASRSAHIRAFMAACSFEATRPDAKDAAALKQFLNPGEQIYISAVPHRPIAESVESSSARAIRLAGLEPVPHIAARHFASLGDCAIVLERLSGEAGVNKIMLIGGDADRPAGDVTCAQDIIDSGLLMKYGIGAIGLAGYPEVHPRIGGDELEAALVTKLASAQSQELAVHIVTQFSFDAKPIIAWIDWLRARGIYLPVKVGLAGPASISTWLSYARRCGVKASASALASRTGLINHLFKAISPAPIISQLAEMAAQRKIVDVSAHIFSFGGIAASARWLNGVQAGHFALERDGGFHVNVS